MTIFLIGMPGSGKSTIGKMLSEKLDLPYFDTDEIISRMEGDTIPKIFENFGEPYFRLKEEELIKNWKLHNAVISTGGGLPCYNNLMQILLSKGHVIWLKVSTEMLSERIMSEPNQRPLFAEKTKQETIKTIKKMLVERKDFYQQATIRVFNDGNSEDVVKKIIVKLYSL
jgi:shikimate kinase